MAHLVCGKTVFHESSPWCQKCWALLHKEWRVDCIKHFFPFGICRHWWLCGDDYNDQSPSHMEQVWTCQFRYGHMPTVYMPISFRLDRRLLPSLVKPETPQAGFPARKYELHICHSTIIASSLALKGLSSEKNPLIEFKYAWKVPSFSGTCSECQMSWHLLQVSKWKVKHF